MNHPMDNITPVELPELPGHPEPHTMRWSRLEEDVIARYGRACYEAGARMASAGAVPEGWMLVPKEPTEDMWTAGREPVLHRDLGHKPALFPFGGDPCPIWQLNPKDGKPELDTSKGTTAVHVWRAMIAAAPAAQVGTSVASAEVARLVEEAKTAAREHACAVFGDAGVDRCCATWDAFAAIIDRLATLSSPAVKVGTEDADVQATSPLPHPGGVEISALLDSILSEYGYPSNPKNAARAGWTAAMRYLAAAPQPPEAMAPAKVEREALTVYVDEEMAGLLRQTIGDDGEPSAIRFEIGDGHSGWGLYVSLAEYPEEGAIQLASIPGPAGEAAKGEQ